MRFTTHCGAASPFGGGHCLRLLLRRVQPSTSSHPMGVCCKLSHQRAVRNQFEQTAVLIVDCWLLIVLIVGCWLLIVVCRLQSVECRK